MDSKRARRIFGLGVLADGREIERSHDRLRRHLDRRPADTPARDEERADLEAARDALVRTRRLQVAVASAGCLLVLGAFVFWAASRLGAGGFGPGLGAGGAGLSRHIGQGELVVASGVPGARIEVRNADGQLQVEGPASGSHPIEPGTSTVSVSHPDCGDAWTRELAVAEGERVVVAPEPCPETGWLVVESGELDGLSIDGEEMGVTGPGAVPLAVGVHDVTVERPGHEPWEGRVEIEPGETLAVRAAPHAAPGQEAPKRARPTPRAAAQNRGPGLDAETNGPHFGPWHERASQWLLSLHDHDRSNALDSPAEIEAVPCRSWTGLEQSFARQGLALSLTRLYGFDGDGFVDGALGVDARVRDVAYARMRECGLN